jgi:hypothetical protein
MTAPPARIGINASAVASEARLGENAKIVFHTNASLTRSIAGCLRFFVLTQNFDLPPW